MIRKGDQLPLSEGYKAQHGAFAVKERVRQSICKKVTIDGVGLFSGLKVTLSFVPSIEEGIFFKRLDLPNSPLIKATIDHLKGTPRCTILGNKEVSIQCVEHVLAAVYALDIDDLVIELDSFEPPICDGSSKEFVRLLEEGGVTAQQGVQKIYYLQQPIYLDTQGGQIIALPSEELKVSYTIAYKNHPLLSSQFYSLSVDKKSFIEELSFCRTFALLEEIELLVEKKVIQGGDLNHGVVIDQERVLNPLGLRCSNEMVRHKILDLIGDLSLVGAPVRAHFIVLFGGHFLHTECAKRIYKNIMEE